GVATGVDAEVTWDESAVMADATMSSRRVMVDISDLLRKWIVGPPERVDGTAARLVWLRIMVLVDCHATVTLPSGICVMAVG
ncbi:MAG TPA: hypothetical protein VD789_03985, partial [Thermomicrobiales bacterium]|nr:hypothetical protein [Thermomicrobiales bacterium]